MSQPTATSDIDVTYAPLEETVTMTIDGIVFTMPKRIVLAIAALGQHMLLEQLQKSSS